MARVCIAGSGFCLRTCRCNSHWPPNWGKTLYRCSTYSMHYVSKCNIFSPPLPFSQDNLHALWMLLVAATGCSTCQVVGRLLAQSDAPPGSTCVWCTLAKMAMAISAYG